MNFFNLVILLQPVGSFSKMLNIAVICSVIFIAVFLLIMQLISKLSNSQGHYLSQLLCDMYAMLPIQ